MHRSRHLSRDKNQQTASAAQPCRHAGRSFWPLAACLAIALAEIGDLPPIAGDPQSADAAQELPRLERFVAALRDEGSVGDIKRCHGMAMCVQVTRQFTGLEGSDRDRIAALLQRYFQLARLDDAPVLSIRFVDADSGAELGYYLDRRLQWRDFQAGRNAQG